MATNRFGQKIGAPLPEWTPRPRPDRTTLRGLYCRIEPLDPCHADPLFAAYAEAPDGRDWTYLPIGRIDDRAAYRAEIAARAASDDPLHHAILDRAGRAVGTAALMRIDAANGVIEIGHVAYSPALQRTPAGTEAIVLLLRHVVDDLGYRRVEWKCDSLNAASRRAALRYGFRFEGIFRQAVVTKGRNRDTAWYAMTDADWRDRRAPLRRWLSAENFNADGCQIALLSALEPIRDGGA